MKNWFLDNINIIESKLKLEMQVKLLLIIPLR